MKRILITIAEIALIVLVILALSAILNSIKAEEDLTEAWVICQPGDYVNVRMNPNRKSRSMGYAECGDQVMTDGKKKNGFIRVYGIGENGEAWIHKGYVVYDEPVKVNRIAYSVSRWKLAARRYIGGKRRCWIKHMQEVKVYWMTDEWCVTDKGFVKTKYLEME